MKTFLTNLHTALLRQLATAGWAGLLGVALGMFAVAFAFSGNRERAAQLSDIAAQRAELASLAAHGKDASASPREVMDAFRARFPAPDALPEILLALDTSARQHELAPRRADYGEREEASAAQSAGRTSPRSSEGFRRVIITMPVKGSYAALRGWLDEALQAQPALTLEGLELQRPGIATPVLDAQVRLAVYLRASR